MLSFPRWTCQAALTILIFDFQSNPKLRSPSWCFLKVRVQGSCACVHTGLPFSSPISWSFFCLSVPEWRDAPQRSRTWISFGLTLWKGQMRAPWNGREAFTLPSQAPESLHHAEMAHTEPLSGVSHRGPEGPAGCSDLVLPPRVSFSTTDKYTWLCRRRLMGSRIDKSDLETAPWRSKDCRNCSLPTFSVFASVLCEIYARSVPVDSCGGSSSIPLQVSFVVLWWFKKHQLWSGQGHRRLLDIALPAFILLMISEAVLENVCSFTLNTDAVNVIKISVSEISVVISLFLSSLIRMF